MLRWAAVGLLVLFGVSFSQPILLYLARGQNAESIATLNDRVLLWTACWSAIQLRPTLGYGFIVGAKNAIKDHWSYSHWLPPHAHNDFIQATLEAGFPACLLVMYIYTWLIIKSINASRKSRGHLFILLVVAQIVVIASTGLVAASQFTTLSAVFVLCCIGSAGNDLKEPVVVTARYRDEMERAIACLPS
jgi:O-antigen ligase